MSTLAVPAFSVLKNIEQKFDETAEGLDNYTSIQAILNLKAN